MSRLAGAAARKSRFPLTGDPAESAQHVRDTALACSPGFGEVWLYGFVFRAPKKAAASRLRPLAARGWIALGLLLFSVKPPARADDSPPNPLPRQAVARIAELGEVGMGSRSELL